MFRINILYLSYAFPETVFDRVFTGKIKPSQAGQKYHNLQIQGLQAAGHEVTALSAAGISRKTYKGLFFYHKKEGCYAFVPVINIPVLRNIMTFFYIFFYTLGKTAGRKKRAILCDCLNLTSVLATMLGAFFTRTQVVGIVTDVPTKRAVAEKSPLKRLTSKLSYALLGRFDKYVFLTEAMNSLINTKGRPYLVSEGHVDGRAEAWVDRPEQKDPQKICLYAGSLHNIYGIESLVQGFLRAAVPNSQLHIYGRGEYEQELRRLEQEHGNLRFFGIRPNWEIVEAERRATLLINPRPTGEEYTKYSFPSKNMEYMVSGTPVLTTRLPGMPEEYLPFVFIPEEETAEGIERALKHILNLPPEELFAKGQEAKAFVLKEKNHIRQGQRITDLLNKKM